MKRWHKTLVKIAFILFFIGVFLQILGYGIQFGIGKSMNLTLPAVNVTIIKKCPCGEDNKFIGVGDIVVFWHEGYNTNVTHRIIEIRNGMMMTQGDGNSYNDGWTSMKKIYSVVSTVTVDENGIKKDSNIPLFADLMFLTFVILGLYAVYLAKEGGYLKGIKIGRWKL